jgi:hypothetical protein
LDTIAGDRVAEIVQLAVHEGAFLPCQLEVVLVQTFKDFPQMLSRKSETVLTM